MNFLMIQRFIIIAENAKKMKINIFAKIVIKIYVTNAIENEEKHVFIDINEMKEKLNSDFIKSIKDFLNNNIIPIKEINENSINEDFISFEKVIKNNEDILLIIEIISQDYTNFFHLQNIKRILRYINLNYNNKFSHIKYEGYGKLIFIDGKYYIGQFKDNKPNGKGILFYKNGNILYEGDFINGKKEGNGKWIYNDGKYYIGQFKDNLRNGIGKMFLSNGIIIYIGIFINDKPK